MDTYFVIRPRISSQVTYTNADAFSSRNATFICVIYIYNYLVVSRVIHYIKIACHTFRNISSPKTFMYESLYEIKHGRYPSFMLMLNMS